MAQPIVQITFMLHIDAGAYRGIFTPAAEAIAGIDGLQWKIWLVNATACEAGGVYLFNDAPAAHAVLDSPLLADRTQAPFLSDFTARQFGVIENLTEVTHGPLSAEVVSGKSNERGGTDWP